MAGLRPFSYGNVLTQGENIKGARLNNVLKQKEINALNSPKPYASRPAAAIQEYEFVKNLRNQPDGEKKAEEFMKIKRKLPPMKWLNEGDQMTGRDANSGEILFTVPISLKPHQEIDYLGKVENVDKKGAVDTKKAIQDVVLDTQPEIEREIAKSKVEGTFAGKKKTGKPARIASLEAKNAQRGMLKKLATELKANANLWTTGFYGSKAAGIAGTKAYDFSQKILTLKTNLGFDKLQDMRNNSPTGGALGNVSDSEGKRLEAVWGSLEQAQSPAAFIKAVEMVEDQIDMSWNNVNAVYRAEYGEDYSDAHWDSVKEKGDQPSPAMTDEDYHRRKALILSQ